MKHKRELLINKNKYCVQDVQILINCNFKFSKNALYIRVYFIDKY